VNRRDFVSTLMLAAGLTPGSRLRLADRAPIAPGIQLYSLRRAMAESLERTLDRVAGLGYREVEFAGYFGRAPAAVRAALAASGLAAPAAHVPLEALEGEALPRSIAAAREIGHYYLIVPSLPASMRGTLDLWRRTADRFNAIGDALRAAGLRFAYHNHAFEFEVLDGQVAYHTLVEHTDPARVGFELDLYWATRGGHDPRHLIQRYPGRFELVHVKDSAGPPDHRMVDLGTGTIPFAEIFALAERAGIRHAFAEHDNPDDPWAFAEAGARVLRRLVAGR
jgi:sugar phosphate isomerase/epimerase